MIRRDKLNSDILKPLGELVTFLDHKRKPVKSSERELGEYIYYGANGAQGFINDYIFDEPLILLAEDGGHFGNSNKKIAYIAEGKYWVNNHAHVLKPNKDIDLRYLCRVLEKYDVTPFITGTTRGKLTKGDACKIPVPYYSLSEQKRIAAILDKADSIRQKREQAIKLADDFLCATFLEMFGDPVENPKGWGVASLLEYGSFKNGMNFTKGESGASLRCLGVGNFKSLATITCMNNIGKIELNTPPSDEYLLKDGDIVFVRSNGNKALVGRCLTIYPGKERVTFSGFCIRYRIENTSITPEYINFLFRTPSMKQQMLSGGQGANIQNISQGTLSSLRIPIPPLEKQQSFSKVVSFHSELMEKMDINKFEINDMFDSISQKYFN